MYPTFADYPVLDRPGDPAGDLPSRSGRAPGHGMALVDGIGFISLTSTEVENLLSAYRASGRSRAAGGIHRSYSTTARATRQRGCACNKTAYVYRVGGEKGWHVLHRTGLRRP